MRKHVLKAVLISGLLAAAPGSAQALDWLHAQRFEGGRVCMVDHFHDGSSFAQPSRAAAERAAIANWVSFTAGEYGGAWGSWRLAASRGINCSNSGGWSCSVTARPCRPGRR